MPSPVLIKQGHGNRINLQGNQCDGEKLKSTAGCGGDLPESWPQKNNTAQSADQISKQVAQIRCALKTGLQQFHEPADCKREPKNNQNLNEWVSRLFPQPRQYNHCQ